MKLRRHKEPRRVTIDDWRTFSGNHWKLEEYLKRLNAEGLERPAVGYNCFRCGKDRDRHTTWDDTAGTGAAPICETCWDELGTPEQRMPWYRCLWLLWEIDRLYDGCPYGRSTQGFPPFEVGHHHPTWDMIETIVNNEV